MKKVLFALVMLFVALSFQANAQDKPLFKLVATTALPGFSGDFDHFAIDLKGKRLFLTAEDHKTVEVFDLDGKPIHSIPGFGGPRTLLVMPETNRLIIVDTDDETVSQVVLVDGKDYKTIDKIKLPMGADSAVYNPVDKNYYVSTDGAETKGKTHLVHILDPKTFKIVGSITLPGDHSEAMAIDREGKKMYVNLRSTKEVGVVDLQSRKVIAQWPLPNAEGNNTLALDEAHRRLFVATRKPAKFFVYDIDTGKVVVTFDCVDTTDDMSVDAPHKRIYVAGSEKMSIFEQKDADHYTRMADFPTGFRGRTSLMVPELKRLYIAISGKGKPNAKLAVQIYDILP
jgi:DNA-binding beta-propeller fold protein YncE